MTALESELALLSTRVGEISEDVREAERSALLNPRSRRRLQARQQNSARLLALDRTAFFTKDLTDTVLAMRASQDPALDGEAGTALTDAIRRAADLVSTPENDPAAPERLRAATTALTAYITAERPVTERRDGISDDVACAVALRHIVDASRGFVR